MSNWTPAIKNYMKKKGKDKGAEVKSTGSAPDDSKGKGSPFKGKKGKAVSYEAC